MLCLPDIFQNLWDNSKQTIIQDLKYQHFFLPSRLIFHGILALHHCLCLLPFYLKSWHCMYVNTDDAVKKIFQQNFRKHSECSCKLKLFRSQLPNRRAFKEKSLSFQSPRQKPSHCFKQSTIINSIAEYFQNLLQNVENVELEKIIICSATR